MKRGAIRLLLISLLFIMIMAMINLTFAIDGEEIMRMVDEKPSPKTSHAALQMDIVEEDGTVKTRLIETWTIEDKEGLEHQVMVFHSPASVKDTRFLQIENKDRDDDQWIYLPALKKVRRIAASEKDSSFMGSEFTYEDLKSKEIEDYSHTLLREGEFNGYDCWVVESIPKNPKDSDYEKIIQWVVKDPDVLMAIKLELYKKANALQKIATFLDLKKISGYWTPQKTTMENVQNNRKTILILMKVEHDKAVSPRLFSTYFLETGRVQ